MVVLVSVRRRSALKGENFVIEFAGGSLTSVGSCTSFVHSPPSEGSRGSLAKFSAFKTLNRVRIRHPLLSAL